MSRPTEIIIYRNPLEQQFWESGMLFPLMCAVVAAIVTMMVMGEWVERVKNRNMQYFLLFGSGGLAAVITYNLLAF